MAPAIGNDTLAYHFQHPKIFIQEHRIGYIPFTRESMWPYLMEMLFTLGLILKSAAVAKMLHLIFGVLTALAVFSFTSRFFSKKYALLAATLFYSAPGIFMQSTYAYTDLATCFYSFSGLYCLLLWLQKERMRLLLLSGIFIGLIFSIKILGIMALMASVSVILYASIGKKRSLRVSAGNLSILCVSALLVSCIWYIRSYVVLGNPVYPFLYSIFKSGWEVDISKYVYASSRGVVEFLRLPWDIVMNIDNFGGEQIGVIFLAFLPVLFFLNFKDKVLRPLLIFLAVYTVAWYCVTPTIRFAFVNYALIYIFIAIGFYKATEKYRLSILKLLLCLCILFNLSLCIYYNRDAIKLQLTAMTEEEYLLQNERTYAIAKFVNKNLPSNSVLIAAEPRLYYFDRKVIAYKMLYRFYGKNLSDYIYKLRRDKIPVYFLCSSNSDCKGIEPFIKDKVPVYKVSSKIQTDERVDYRLYKL